MNLDKLTNGLAFDKDSGVVGKISSIHLVEGVVKIIDSISGDTFVALLEDVTFLEQVGAIGERAVFNHDVVATADGKLFEIESVSEQSVRLNELNDQLEIIGKGEVIAKTDLHVLAPYVEVIGSIYELEAEEADFNILIVRDMTGGEFKGYLYACNLPEVGNVDLVNLLFAGHELLEEKYTRKTVTIEEFEEMIANGSLRVVELNEVINYLTGMESFAGEKAVEPVEKDEPEPQIAVDEEPAEDCDCIDCRLAREDKKGIRTDVCEDCGEPFEDCECDF